MSKTEAVICALLRKATPHKLSKTALIKLCYFIDLEHTRRFGSQITAVEWRQDEFGAVAYDIPNTARTIPGVDVFDYTTHSGKHGTDFCAGEGLGEYESQLGINERAVIDDIYGRFGQWGAVRLGNASKETEPWLAAERASVKELNLSVVAPQAENRFAHFARVLEEVDLSTRGTPEEIAELEDETERFMTPFRLEALRNG